MKKLSTQTMLILTHVAHEPVTCLGEYSSQSMMILHNGVSLV